MESYHWTATTTAPRQSAPTSRTWRASCRCDTPAAGIAVPSPSFGDRPKATTRFIARSAFAPTMHHAVGCSQHGSELIVQCLEGLGDDVHVGQYGHEVRVARPTRDDVPVQMPGQSGAGDLSQVEPDVITLRLEDLIEHADHASKDLRAIEQLVVAKVGQGGLVGEGRNQEMAVIIGVAVEHRGAQGRPHEDEVLAILAGGEGVAQETAAPIVSLAVHDVIEAPGGPNLFLAHGYVPPAPGREGMKRSCPGRGFAPRSSPLARRSSVAFVPYCCATESKVSPARAG